MTDPVCPACGEPVLDARRVGPVTFVLDPCGHQVDDRLYDGLFCE